MYVGDITYMPCMNGSNMYLATVIDLYSRKLAGFAIADHMRSSLVIEALDHANTVRGGLVVPSFIQIMAACTHQQRLAHDARNFA